MFSCYRLVRKGVVIINERGTNGAELPGEGRVTPVV